MLTAKEMQTLLQVDRSTVYRMAEAGRLPAFKVGRQWRFPTEQVHKWLDSRVAGKGVGKGETAVSSPTISLSELLPLQCVQLVQDSHAELLGVMLLITDMDGNPITEISNPCGLFSTISQQPHAVQKCIQSWQQLAINIDLQPRFHKTHLNLLCARGLIRVGTELKGMVVAGCVTPDEWPPSPKEVQVMADVFDVNSHVMSEHLDDAYQLDPAQRAIVLSSVQKVANIVAHMVKERKDLVGKLQEIADLTKL